MLGLRRPAVFRGPRLQGGDHARIKIADEKLEHAINDSIVSASRPRPSYVRYLVIFQNVIPLACWPTSTVPAMARACRSITSTLPGAEPTPSLLMNA